MTSFERMIHCTYPNAIPGKDFTLMTGKDGNPEIDYWNTEKLGVEPSISAVHASYMRWAKKKKELLPTFDDTDPAPWLNKQHNVNHPEERAETYQHAPKTEKATIPIPGTVQVYPNGIITRRIK
jgi:hypothetical protein